ncbi:MAG TPA: DUF5684 domain-containing protein [Flavisolibacter sp.]|jgi:hypothetical protein|nr:DUF5684 domain-containing protein [Flavisolibacter sp.]
MNTTLLTSITTILLVLILIAAVMLASLWKIFQKAGKPGWAALIPFYNYYMLLKIAGKPGTWMWLLFIPIVNYVYLIWTYNMISKSFGKSEGFTVGLVLVGIVFWLVLAFGDSVYLGPYGNREAFAAYQNANRFDFEER